MITVIVTSRASALKRELVDHHFSPCSTLPTLPTTSTETWLFLKVFFLVFQNMWISLSQELWSEISFQHQIVWPQQNFYYLTAGEKESLIIVSLLPFREVSLRWNQDFFWTQKTDKSLLCKRQQRNWLFSGFLVQPKPRPAQSQTVEFWLNFLSTQAGRSFWIVLITRKRSIGWYLSCSNKT